MDKACSIEPLVGSHSALLNTVIKDLKTIIDQFAAAKPTAKLLMTGYVIPKSAPQESCKVDKFAALEKAMKEACDAKTICTWISVSKLAKGSDT